MLGFARWIDRIVGDAVIHGREACRLHVADHRHLDRRWFPGKHEEPVLRGMTREVYEDVDLVSLDRSREFRVR